MYNRLKRSFISKTFLNYGLIGITGVLLDFGVYAVLVKLGMHPIIASAISVTVGITNNYYWNAKHNFKVKDKYIKRFASFYGVGGVGILLTSIILFICHDTLGLGAMLSKIISIPPVVGVQFLLNKKITFGASSSSVRNILQRLLYTVHHGAAAILGVMLLLLSIVYYVPKVRTVSLIDSSFIMVSLLICASLIAIITYIIKIKHPADILIRNLHGATLILYLLAGLAWILLLQGRVAYSSDSAVIIDSMVRPETLPWNVAVYLQTFPYQDGYVIFVKALWKLFGTENFTVVWLANMIAVIATVHYVIKITRLLFSDKRVVMVSYILLILNAPMLLYGIPMFYGDIIGNSLLLAGIYYFIKYIIHERGNDLARTIPILVMAVVFKANTIIILLFMALFGFYLFLIIGKKRFAILMVFVICLAFGAQAAIKSQYEARYNLITDATIEPMPRTKWIAMGLQYGKYNTDDPYEVTRARKIALNEVGVVPGAWNGFTSMYWGDDSLESFVLASVRTMAHDPLYAVNFMIIKGAYVWANSSMGVPSKDNWHYGYGVKDLNNFILSPVFSDHSTVSTLTSYIARASMILVYVGFASFAFFRFKHKFKTTHTTKHGELLIVIIIIYGAAFYCIWEGMARYATPYYLLMLPLASSGLVLVSDRLRVKNTHCKN